MYSINNYGDMISDSARMDAYAAALRRAVTPKSVVVDIGAGMGIFALLACKYGAKRVYAIEPNDSIHVGREMASDNNYGDQITFIQGLSTEISLPEPADIIISDIRGKLPLIASHIPTIVDARTRFLAPDGILIAQQDTISAAPVETPELLSQWRAPWIDNGYKLDMSAAYNYEVNRWYSNRVNEDQLLADSQIWIEIDYPTISQTDFKKQMAWTVSKSGVVHGISTWFDTTTADGIGFSNAPGVANPTSVYGSVIFPLSRPVNVNKGDQITVSLHASLVNDNYIWSWATRIVDSSNPPVIRADFRQSTYYADPLHLSSLKKRGSSFVPKLREIGEIRQLTLGLMDGVTSLEQISRHVSQQFPDRYATWQDALPDVGQLSQKYSI